MYASTRWLAAAILRDPQFLVITTGSRLWAGVFLRQMNAAIEAIGHAGSRNFGATPRGGRVDESNPGHTRDARPGEQRSRFVTRDEGRYKPGETEAARFLRLGDAHRFRKESV